MDKKLEEILKTLSLNVNMAICESRALELEINQLKKDVANIRKTIPYLLERIEKARYL